VRFNGQPKSNSRSCPHSPIQNHARLQTVTPPNPTPLQTPQCANHELHTSHQYEVHRQVNGGGECKLHREDDGVHPKHQRQERHQGEDDGGDDGAEVGPGAVGVEPDVCFLGGLGGWGWGLGRGLKVG